MRKRLITPIPQDAPPRDEEWLDLDRAASVEVTSEENDYPVESAVLPLYCGKTVLGIIEMFSQQIPDVSWPLKEFLFSLGGQMGVFLGKLAADRALDSVDAQFRLVAQAASVAVFTIDEQSNILFVNSAVERIFGYKPEELIGGKLTVVMPEYLRHVHEHALRRYVLTGRRHISWEGVPLPGLHKNGTEIPLVIAFGEFLRKGGRVFTGFVRLQ